jgi:hypothetical protein
MLLRQVLAIFQQDTQEEREKLSELRKLAEEMLGTTQAR